MVYLYSGILFRKEKEIITDTCKNVDGSINYQVVWLNFVTERPINEEIFYESVAFADCVSVFFVVWQITLRFSGLK